MFGVPPIFDAEKDPFCALQPVICEPSDLRKLKVPDFFETDPMPLVHQKYRELCALVDGRLRVTFPGWSRSPWSVATFLRGFTPLYMDIMERPDFVRELLDFIAECRISWEKQRCAFLSISAMDLEDDRTWYSDCYVDYRPVHVSDYFSDEVDGAMLSPEMYANVVFPSELKLARFYGRTRYYHSCGNLTPLLPTLLRLPGIRMLHVSSWTDLAEARRRADPSIVLQKVVHPQDDVMKAGEDRIRTQIRDILALAPDRKLLICADAIYEGEVSRVKTWLRIAKQAVREAQGGAARPAEATG
jgi:uroporphyrinogen-III decarboxylase